MVQPQPARGAQAKGQRMNHKDTETQRNSRVGVFSVPLCLCGAIVWAEIVAGMHDRFNISLPNQRRHWSQRTQRSDPEATEHSGD
jgi:hypothetical protein